LVEDHMIMSERVVECNLRRVQQRTPARG
jgi:hypothetical protein